MRKITLVIFLAFVLTAALSCRQRNTDGVTVALPDKFSSFDTLTSTGAPDAPAERIRVLIFNSLVRKDANYDYVGELAKDIITSDDGKTLTFTLRDNIKFHNGKDLTSADVKYTFDQLFKSEGGNSSFKAGAFFDIVPIGKVDEAVAPAPAPAAANSNVNAAAKTAATPKTKKVSHIISIEAPDPKTIVFSIERPGLRSQVLSNLVAIPIIPEGSVGQLKEQPIGSGPFKFVNFDASQNVVELAANTEYWDGAPKITKLRIKTVTDATALQAELQTGGVDIAPNPSNLPSDMLKALGTNANLNVDQFDGSNIQYLVFNTQSPPLDNIKVRQAIAFAIDRQKIVTELFSNQAKIAESVLPPQSWAYSSGKQYTFDQNKGKQLLQEAGYKGEPITFKYAAGNAAVNQYAQVIQSSLNEIGLNIQIETLESNTIRQQLAQAQFQMYTGVWIGGNQDPIFFRNLFSSTMIPSAIVPCCNRGRYRNEEVDKKIMEAVDEKDKANAKVLYGEIWGSVSEDVPLFPLWYPSNIVVSNKRIGNIKMSGSGDWVFLKDITAN